MLLDFKQSPPRTNRFIRSQQLQTPAQRYHPHHFQNAHDPHQFPAAGNLGHGQEEVQAQQTPLQPHHPQYVAASPFHRPAAAATFHRQPRPDPEEAVLMTPEQNLRPPPRQLHQHNRPGHQRYIGNGNHHKMHHQQHNQHQQQQAFGGGGALKHRDRAKSVPNLDMQEEMPQSVTDERTGVVYTIGKLLGRGGFAQCFLARSNHQYFALKVISREYIKREPDQLSKIRREIMNHYSLRHPNIVALYSTFECPQNIYMLLEFCPNRTLAELIERSPDECLAESKAIVYMKQLLLAVRYLHEDCQLLHRDIKPGNILLSHEWTVKLADFGFCCSIAELARRRTHTICGTPNYVAPEVIDKLGHNVHSDCWAVACTFYSMLYGRPPFHSDTHTVTYARIRRCDFVFPQMGLGVSDEAKQLIRKTLVLRPDRRLNAVQMLTHSALNPRPSFDATTMSNDDDINTAEFAAMLGMALGIDDNDNRRRRHSNETPPPPVANDGVPLPPRHFDPTVGAGRRRKAAPDPPLQQQQQEDLLLPSIVESSSNNGTATTAFASSLLMTPTVADATNTRTIINDTATFGDTPVGFGAGADIVFDDEEEEEGTPPIFGGGGGGDSGLGLGGSAEFSPSHTGIGPLGKTVQLTVDKYMQMLHSLLAPFNGINLIPMECPSDQQLPNSFVTKWVDYTNKFGFGVTLHDGTRSLLFNDQSSISTTHCQNHFSYHANKFSENCLEWSYREGFPNSDICKKVSILQCIRKYMDSELCSSAPIIKPPSRNHQQQQLNFAQLFGRQNALSNPPKVDMLRRTRANNNHTSSFTSFTGAKDQQLLVHIIDFRKFPGALFIFLSDGTCQINFTESHHKMAISVLPNSNGTHGISSSSSLSDGLIYQLHLITADQRRFHFRAEQNFGLDQRQPPNSPLADPGFPPLVRQFQRVLQNYQHDLSNRNSLQQLQMPSFATYC